MQKSTAFSTITTRCGTARRGTTGCVMMSEPSKTTFFACAIVGDGPVTTFRAIVIRAAIQELLDLAYGSQVGDNFQVLKKVEKLKPRFFWMKIAIR